MKRLLNTLYITTDDAWLRKDGANLVVELDGKEIGRLPAHLLDGVVCLGRIGLSTPMIAFCAEQGITISLCTGYGRFQARIEGPQSGNVLLRRTQHRLTETPEQSLPVAQAIVTAKLANQRTVLSRALRDHADSMQPIVKTRIDEVTRRLSDAARNALSAEDLDSLRGIEGDAANAYFSVFDKLIRRDETELRFKGRSRRPPLDAPNAILSFLYAMLGHDCRSAIEGVGLDPQMGFLHRDRPGRSSLGLDLLEEVRAPIADRVCLSLLNRKQISARDFRFEPGGAVLLTDEGRKTVLTTFQERKRTEITHPFLNEKMPLGLVPHIQAQLLARYMRGDLDGYPSFFWK